MPIAGTGLQDKNVRLRFLMICFCGVVAFAAILYWREKEILSQEYVDLSRPEANQRLEKEKEKPNRLEQQNLREELNR